MDDKLIVGQREAIARVIRARLIDQSIAIRFQWTAATPAAFDEVVGEIADAILALKRDHMPAVTPTPVPAAVEERAGEAKHVIGRLLAETHYGNHALVSAADVNALTAALTNAQPIRAGVREALGDFCLSAECAAGVNEGATEDEAASEIMSSMGSAMAVSYTNARAALATPDDALTERASVIEECARVAARYPMLLGAFRTTSGGPSGYVMTFKFRSIEDLHAADREWHSLRRYLAHLKGDDS